MSRRRRAPGGEYEYPKVPVGPGGRCTACGGSYWWGEGAWWCSSAPCRVRQASGAVGIKLADGRTRWLYVPSLRACEFEESRAKNR
jgi:hypothetical protein